MVTQVALRSLKNRWEACNLAKVEVICAMVLFNNIIYLLEKNNMVTWLTNSSKAKKKHPIHISALKSPEPQKSSHHCEGHPRLPRCHQHVWQQRRRWCWQYPECLEVVLHGYHLLELETEKKNSPSPEIRIENLHIFLKKNGHVAMLLGFLVFFV